MSLMFIQLSQIWWIMADKIRITILKNDTKIQELSQYLIFLYYISHPAAVN